eukprot:8454109-Prorocentrum_lima.AAC.1
MEINEGGQSHPGKYADHSRGAAMSSKGPHPKEGEAGPTANPLPATPGQPHTPESEKIQPRQGEEKGEAGLQSQHPAEAPAGGPGQANCEGREAAPPVSARKEQYDVRTTLPSHPLDESHSGWASQ